MEIPKPKWYHSEHKSQTLGALICNALVMESYYNDKGNGLTIEELSDVLKKRKSVKATLDDIKKEVESFHELSMYKGKIVKNTWLEFPGHFLGIKRE